MANLDDLNPAAKIALDAWFTMKAERDKLAQVLLEIRPYLDSLVCYASTINEHLPNGFPARVDALLHECGLTEPQRPGDAIEK